MICLTLDRRTIAANLSLLERHRGRIDAAELRADLLAEDQLRGIVSFVRAARESAGEALPLVFSIRRTRDGGAFAGSEHDRLRLLGSGIDAGFRYVDLERDLRESTEGRAVAGRAVASACEVIRSAHFPEGQPAAAAAVIRDLAGDRSEIARLEATPDSTEGLLELLAAADETTDVRKIIVAHGPYGTPSRVLSRRFGSMFSCVPDSTDEHAPSARFGPDVLTDLYRFHGIGPETRLFSIIGSPISHSRSPEFHNRRFAADGIDACYVSVLVDDVEMFFRLAERLPLQGSSVTIPHKEAVLPHLREVDEGTTAAGACNTIVRTGDGWRGVNTDVPGFLGPLAPVTGGAPGEAPAKGAELEGWGATVIGAGGAARAIVYGLLREGARVKVLNRSPDRAQALAKDLAPMAPADSAASVKWAPLEPGADLEGFTDIVVQTTSVGMDGQGDPVPWLEFTGKELVYDVVYTPPDTPFIRRARGAGCRTVTGDRMFAAQGEEQYRLFSRLARA